jgi:hypothetical protein
MRSSPILPVSKGFIRPVAPLQEMGGFAPDLAANVGVNRRIATACQLRARR